MKIDKDIAKYLFYSVIGLGALAYGYFTAPPPELIYGSEDVTHATEVHFIDVGQGDAALIISGDNAVLIDGGENNDEEFIVNYLTEQGVDDLSLIVGTHPHEDHIGGIDAVINAFPTEKVLLAPQSADTDTYNDVITAIEQTGTTIETAEVGTIYEISGGVSLTLLGPEIEFSNTNDNSLIMRLDVGIDSVLFTGDAEKPAEEHLLEIGANLDTYILKVGHHGSDTSSTVDFINAVTPEIAVISCGYDNEYGHPHEATIDTLEKMGSEIFVTSEDGSIVFAWDENGKRIDAEKLSPVA